MMAVIYNEELTTQLENDFKKDLAECVSITEEEMYNMPIPIRVRNSLARLLSPIL